MNCLNTPVIPKADIRIKDIIVFSYTILYFIVLSVLYATMNEYDYTEVGRYTTVLTHFTAIPVLIETRDRKYLSLYIFIVVIVSTIYHMSQVGWWWSVPVDDNPWQRLDHGFSTLLVFVLSVTLWYKKIPWEYILCLSFIIMSVSVAFKHTKLVGLSINSWIGAVIALINVVFVIYETCSKNPQPRRNAYLLWIALIVFGIAVFFYLYPILHAWEWYFHSAWHVAVFAAAYFIIRSEENEQPDKEPKKKNKPLLEINEMSQSPLRF